MATANGNCEEPNCLFLRFTTYNVIAVITVLIASRIWLFPESVVDVVRATTVIVALSVLSIYATYGPSAVLSLYKRVHPWISTPFQLLFDWSVHVLPLVIMGPPKRLLSYVIALGILWLWYFGVHRQIQHLYITFIPKRVYNWIIFAAIPLMLVVVYVIVNFDALRSGQEPK